MPKATPTDSRWLELHGKNWRVTVAVPRALKPVLGTRLKQDLKTGNLAVANRLKPKVVAALRARIEAARKARSEKPKDVIREAVEVARMAERARGPWERAEVEEHIRRRSEEILGAEVGFRAVVDEDGYDDDEPVYDREREGLALEFLAVARGTALPLAAVHDDYLSKSKVKRRTLADDVRALRYLTAWCERERIPATVQAITRKRAVSFSDDLGTLSGDLAWRTQNKYLNRLSRYWAYLLKRELVEHNPWFGLTVEADPTPYDEQERKFTEAEVQRLLMGGAEPRLMDLMMIGALTGARLDAIVDLKVADVVGGAFTFKPQKKAGKPRDVPIHPALREVVARRTEGRGAGDDLFPEWPAPRAESQRERSFKASNAFTAYRRKVGVDDVVEGRRRALTNFHSFRRWFATKADRTGAPDRIVKAILGHDGLGLTFSLYSEGPDWRAAKRCISKVQLPPLDGSPAVEVRPLRPRNRKPAGPSPAASGPTGPRSQSTD